MRSNTLAAADLARSLLAFLIPLSAPQIIDTWDGGGNKFLPWRLSIVIGIPLPPWVYFQGGNPSEE